MKLLIRHCDNCRNAIGLNIVAPNRSKLRQRFNGDAFRVRCGTCGQERIYNVGRVVAERDANGTATGAVVGGLVGLLGGPIGLLIGGGLGAAIGGANDTEESQKVRNFNSSW